MSPSLKAGEEQGPSSSNQAEGENTPFLLHFVLFKPFTGWVKPTNTNMNLFRKHPYRHTQKYSLARYLVPHGPVKLIYKISHPRGEGRRNPPDTQNRGSRVSSGHHTALMIPIMSLYCQLNVFNYKAIKPPLLIGGLSDCLRFPGRVSVLRSRGDP